jgi:hypothetical protein
MLNVGPWFDILGLESSDLFGFETTAAVPVAAANRFSSFDPRGDSRPQGTPRRRTERTGIILLEDSLLETENPGPSGLALGEGRISSECDGL